MLAPLVAQGAIVRRPRATAWAERHQTDRTARAVLTALRERYDGAPLVLRLGPRRLVVVTDADDVRRLLDGSPEPFTPATREKTAALGHFQPEGVLVSSVADRRERRPFNEAALRTDQPLHDAADAVVDAVRTGAARIADRLAGGLDGAGFVDEFWDVVLEVVLGPRARGDRDLVGALNALRRDANWAYLRPRRTAVRERLHARIASYLADPEPGTVAEVARAAGPDVVASQVPHWLFAYDAAGAATLRALAVVAARTAVRERLLAEAAAAGPGPAELPYARACVQESLRLWPTTLVVLRDSTAPTEWGGRTLPSGTGFAVVSSFFHRDPDRLPHADGFVPEGWLDGGTSPDLRADRAVIPFSGGPVVCPGRDLVLLTTSHLLARLAEHDLRVARGRYLARDPLPATMDHLGLRFRLARH